MATDPNLTDEQKRRQRDRERGVVSIPATRATLARTAPMSAFAPNLGAVAARQEIMAGNNVDEPPAPAAPRADFSNVQSQVRRADQNLGSDEVLRGAGLTRITKSRDANGNSVYSNVGPAPAGAETRYYGALGNRADVTGAVTPRGPNDHYGADQALDLNTEAGRTSLFENATNQRRGLGRMVANNQANDQDLQWVADPNTGRNTVMSREQREFVNPQLAAARVRAGASGGLDAGDQIALLRLQNDISNQSANRDLQERGLARQEQSALYQQAYDNDGNLRPNFIQSELAQIRGRSPEEMDQFFATDRGRFVQSAINDQLQRAYSDTAAPFAGSPGNLGELQQTPWYNAGGWFDDRYVAAGDELQSGVNAEELGIPKADMEALMQYYASRNARR